MSDDLHDALIEYDFDGGRYSFSIPCVSWVEAEAKVRAIKASGRVLGWPAFHTSANPVTFPFGVLIVRIKAWLFNRKARP